MQKTPASIQTFHRSPFTWLAYAMLGYFAYAQSSLGPIMPLLRQELNLSFTLGGLHASGFALGAVAAGLSGDAIATRSGSRAAFWGSGAGLAVGLLLLAAAPAVLFTLPATLFMGFFGGLLLVMVQATLSDEHNQHRSVALLEANIAAMVTTSLLPLLVGGFARTPLGWRPALLVPVLAWGGMWLAGRRTTMPPAAAPEPLVQGKKQPLPPLFWLLWIITFLSVSAEWCMALWTADFLIASTGIQAATAALLVILFTGGGIAGRFIGSRLARRFPTLPLLILALFILLAGFPVFWLVESLLLKLIGLFLVGFGAMMLYPLAVAAGTELAPGRANRASARISLAAGVAILINPQALGVAADALGIQTAIGLVAAFSLLALLLTLLLWHLQGKGTPLAS